MLHIYVHVGNMLEIMIKKFRNFTKLIYLCSIFMYYTLLYGSIPAIPTYGIYELYEQ